MDILWNLCAMHVSGRSGKQYRLQQDGRKDSRGRHSEEKGIEAWRGKGSKQTYPPAVFIGTHQREQVDRQPGRASHLHRVAELRKNDISRNEQYSHQISLYLAVFK